MRAKSVGGLGTDVTSRGIPMLKEWLDLVG